MLSCFNVFMSLEKQYDPKQYEEDIYRTWEASGYFNPDNLPGERPETFSIVLPPPNVTGTLHTGHALMLAVEDIMVRFERMRGKKALWVPGTDHAAIATQSKVESQLYEEDDKTRHDLGREAFLEKVETFAQESHDVIVEQLKKMGGSLDWSREAFTLDEQRERAVFEAFRRMYEAGLIYRKDRVVNWDPEGQTTVSDDEVVYKEGMGTLYTFKYSEDFPFTIATTRPETKVGDTAVAVHPDDERYKEYVGNTYNVEFAGVPIEVTVVADEEVDPEFGTGALGVTPAHSIADWEIAQRHDLPLKQVINEGAKMTVGPYEGMDVREAREAIFKKLEADGLLEKTEEIEQSIATAERTGGIIEPLPKLQWWIDVNKPFTLEHSNIDGIAAGEETTLKKIMTTVVESGQIDIVPGQFEKIYFNWVSNLRDWNISRQIWYGHRVPVWYKDGEMKVSLDSPGKDWEQDPDTLDTWFSSGLWTFSTLGWPEDTEDLELYHPTDVLETGPDIIFFWVARMILMTGFLLGDVPFKNVYLHGMVRDEKGQKMSKSLDNIVDPRDLIDEFGADALRMAMIVGNPAGADVNLGKEKVKAYKHFANKMWNATRFALMNLEDFDPTTEVSYTEWDQKMLNELADVVKDVTGDIEEFRYHLASEKLYHYFWHTFADIIIEETKGRLYENDDEQDRQAAQKLVYTVLATCLKMLHPFMPFITEVLWKEIPHAEDDADLLIIERWPESHEITRTQEH